MVGSRRFFCATGLDFADGTTQTLTGGAHFILQLQVHPKLFGHTEETGQSDSGVCGNAAPFQDNVINPWSGDVKTSSQFVGGETHWLEKLFAKNLAGMNLPRGGCVSFLWHQVLPLRLVIIRNLDIKSITVSPCEANPELIVNPDAELSFALCLQRFETVTGRNSQVV
jgi:hypothetical protein